MQFLEDTLKCFGTCVWINPNTTGFQLMHFLHQVILKALPFLTAIWLNWTRNSMKNLVIFWVSWCKNKSFWKRFTCTLLCEVTMNFIDKCFVCFFHPYLRIKSKASAYMSRHLHIKYKTSAYTIDTCFRLQMQMPLDI